MSLAETREDLSDERIDAMIADPARIATHDEALELIDILDHDIAHIQTQVDSAQIEANARPLSANRMDWLRRASYACAMKRNQRHRVMQRDKEIRGTKQSGEKPKDPELGKLKQARMLEEAQAKRAAKLAEIEREKTKQLDIAQKNRDLKAGILRSALKDIAELAVEQGAEWAQRRAIYALDLAST